MGIITIIVIIKIHYHLCHNHLAYDIGPKTMILYVFLSLEARTLVTKLKTMRSPMAAVLERRIDLTERIQVLEFKRVKMIPRHELLSHIKCIEEASVVIPFRIRLDLFEVQVENAMNDFFSESMSNEEVEEMAEGIAEKFAFFRRVHPDSNIQESNLLMSHILNALQEDIQMKKATNMLDADSAKEEAENGQKAG